MNVKAFNSRLFLIKKNKKKQRYILPHRNQLTAKPNQILPLAYCLLPFAFCQKKTPL